MVRYQTDCFGAEERLEWEYPGARSRADRSRFRALLNAPLIKLKEVYVVLSILPT
jgi:hypothetical protein